jgi:uracil-DNA glycosylase family 4
MKPLTEYIIELRKKKGIKFEIPDFDPCDGGVDARLLLVAEAPGPKAIESGFVSRNNNDQTAENTNRILSISGLKREETILWNIVPWYIGEDGNIRTPTPNELEEGAKCLDELLNILTNLRAIVMVGGNAQKALKKDSIPQRLKVFETYHPSPRNLNTKPDMEKKITQVFTEAKRYLDSLDR